MLDTTVLVSAFLRPVESGVSFELLGFAKAGQFALYLSRDILDEVTDVLTTHDRMRRRYRYPDAAIVKFCGNLERLAVILTRVPSVRIVRDPEDDKILACAIAARRLSRDPR